MNARPSQTGIEPRAAAATGDRALLVAMLVYGALSLAHFVHGAVYLQAYPNLPDWLTPGGVAASWLVIGAAGAIGWLLYRRVSQGGGLAASTVHALLAAALLRTRGSLPNGQGRG